MSCTAFTNETSESQTTTAEKYTKLRPDGGRIGGERGRMETTHYSEAFPYDDIRNL